MDRISDSDSEDVGSIPTGTTIRDKKGSFEPLSFYMEIKFTFYHLSSSKLQIETFKSTFVLDVTRINSPYNISHIIYSVASDNSGISSTRILLPAKS